LSKEAAYTTDELVLMLKNRQGGLTQQQFALEIGISLTLLNQIMNGTRSVGNRHVLEYLAPKGKKFIERFVYHLVSR
jgi:transcriptional regulator with XRE-family HTH domain